MATTAPLVLLFDISPQSILTDLTKALQSIQGCHILSDQIEYGIENKILFCGIAMSLCVNSVAENYTSTKRVFCNLGSSNFVTKLSISLGDSVSEGIKIPPILSKLLLFSSELGIKIGAIATVWTPAKIISGFPYFSETVEAYGDGGPFPLLSLIDFLSDKNALIYTSGLGYIADQEIEFSMGNLNKNDAMQRIVRIAHDIATNGAILENMNIPGLDDDEMVFFKPDYESQILYVSVSSKSDH